jgi:hypothetical protein
VEISMNPKMKRQKHLNSGVNSRHTFSFVSWGVRLLTRITKAFSMGYSLSITRLRLSRLCYSLPLTVLHRFS